MTSRTLAGLFAALLPVLLLVALPLRIALEWSGPAGQALTARMAAGSVWNGRLEDAFLAGIPLGDAELKLSPLSLVTGSPAVRLVSPTLTTTLQMGRRQGLAQADGSLLLPADSLMPGAGLILRAERLTALFSADTCLQASGLLNVALVGPDSAPLAVFEGPAVCSGRSAVLSLASAGGEGLLAQGRATLRFHPDGQWEVEVQVPGTQDPRSRQMLEAMGFLPGPGGWSRMARGVLAGA